MARPLRIELAGGLYHVTSRGDRREDILFSEDDRQEGPPYQAMAKAYLKGDYSMKKIADFFDVQYATVSRAVKRFESEIHMTLYPHFRLRPEAKSNW